MSIQFKYFECACFSDEHLLKFHLDDEDNTLTASIFLNQWRSWYGRIWIAIKYLFGYKSKYGDWDCWLLRKEDAERLKGMLIDYINGG